MLSGRVQCMPIPPLLFLTGYFLATDPSKIINTPITRFLSQVTGLPVPVVTPTAVDGYMGAAYGCVGIGLSYVFALGTGDEKFVYNAVPARFILFTVVTAFCFLSKHGSAPLLAFALGDLLSAIPLGLTLGRWTGWPGSNKIKRN